MRTVHDFREAIRKFNEVTARLWERSFVKDITAKDAGYTIRCVATGEMCIETRLPGDEAVEAICNSLRMLLQPRDKFSFNQMSEFYRDPAIPIDAAIRADFETDAAVYAAYMAKPSVLEGYSNWELLEIVLYGKLSHFNTEKEALVEQWKKIPGLFESIQAEVQPLLAHVLLRGRKIAEINRRALAGLP